MPPRRKTSKPVASDSSTQPAPTTGKRPRQTRTSAQAQAQAPTKRARTASVEDNTSEKTSSDAQQQQQGSTTPSYGSHQFTPITSTTMAAISLKPAHDALIQALESQTPASDPAPIRSQLTKLKIGLTEAGLLVPAFGVQPTAAQVESGSVVLPADVDSLVMARDILEAGAFFSIRVKDVKAFDRYMALLGVYYNDYASQLPASTNHEPLLGLQLLRLLSSNDIAAFHTALEAIPAELVQQSPYLRHPVDLERWLMEGSYSKVWRAQREAPREEHRFFVDNLMGTIRREIASCEEKAYDSLPLQDAAVLLFFDNVQDIMAFAQERGWTINPSTQTVHFAQSDADARQAAVPRQKTIALNLQFARELESIV